jgi:hypothetical protein
LPYIADEANRFAVLASRANYSDRIRLRQALGLKRLALRLLDTRLPPQYTLPSEATLKRGNDKEWRGFCNFLRALRFRKAPLLRTTGRARFVAGKAVNESVQNKMAVKT